MVGYDDNKPVFTGCLIRAGGFYFLVAHDFNREAQFPSLRSPVRFFASLRMTGLVRSVSCWASAKHLGVAIQYEQAAYTILRRRTSLPRRTGW